MLFAHIFKFNEMFALIAQNGGTHPRQQMQVWKDIMSANTEEFENSVDWDTTLRIAEQAAIPQETIFESADALEASENSRMEVLTEEQHEREFVFFDNCLTDAQIISNTLRRVVLLSKDVYCWLTDSDATSKSDFIEFLDALKPDRLRKHRGELKVVCTRRSVVGIKKTYEVLCAPLKRGTESEIVVLFTPFVSSAVDGVTVVGVLGMYCPFEDITPAFALFDTPGGLILMFRSTSLGCHSGHQSFPI